jgi:hypothetical protein
MVLDLRCEVAAPATDDIAWEEIVVACGIALETAIRERVPEYFP